MDSTFLFNKRGSCKAPNTTFQLILSSGGSCRPSVGLPRPHPWGVGYSHTLPIRVCTTQQGRDFKAPDLEQGIHFRGVF